MSDPATPRPRDPATAVPLASVLARLGRLSITARQAVEGLLAGQHRSVRRGLAVEFAGHRAYEPGDDLRRLDWAVSARSDRLVVRLDEEERRLRALLVLDASGSMAYGTPSKWSVARTVGAAAAFLLVMQADAVGLQPCGGNEDEPLAPGSTMGHLMRLFDRLDALSPAGPGPLAAAVLAAARSLDRRGLLLVITDAFTEPGPLADACAFARHRQHEVRVVQLVAPAEEVLSPTGTTEFIGLEGEGRRRLDADRLRPYYQRDFQAHRAVLAARLAAAGATLVQARSDQDPANILALLTQARRC